MEDPVEQPAPLYEVITEVRPETNGALGATAVVSAMDSRQPEDDLSVPSAVHTDIASGESEHEDISLDAIDPEPIWLRRPRVARMLGLPLSVTKQATDALQTERPDLFRPVLGTRDDSIVECSSEIFEYLPAPTGWGTEETLANELGVSTRSIQRLISKIRDNYDKSDFRRAKGFDDISPRVHISPTVANNVREVIGQRQEKRQKREKRQKETDDFKAFSDEMIGRESLDAQEFEQLVGIFGAESAFDVLTQYRQEFTSKHLVPYVKSFLADYLGDFLVRKGEMDFDNINQALPYLSNKNLQLALTEVIKRHCLKTYHAEIRDDPNQDDFELIAKYLDDINQRTKDLDNEQIQEVIKSVEEYYLSLFEIDIPPQFVDSLSEGRPFPDLNQRINIKEMVDKRRMLIGDEPGMGKSASAILTKEIVGSKCAVIINPSQVMEEQIWQTYLSDRVDEKGKPLGYFRPGQTPKILEVKRLSDLDDVKAEDYDYILISQEKIDQKYTDALMGVDYDMLIVDEAHRFKNIRDGVRSGFLIDMAKKLNSKDHMMLLTATPAPNKVADIAMSIRLLYPKRYEQYTNPDLIYKIMNGDLLDIRSLLLPRMQMKRLADSMEMPPHHEETIWLEMSDYQREAYEVIMEEWEMDASEKMQILRQSLMNPRILDATPQMTGSKVDKVGDDLEKVFKTKDKSLMFVNGYITDIIRGDRNMIPDLNIPADVDVRVIHGDTKLVSKAARRQAQYDFQHKEGKMLLIVSGQTVSVGVDLSAADDVRIYNDPWTKTEKTQEIGRALRPSRKGELTSATYVTRGTVEEGIHLYIEAKNRAIEKLLYGIPLTDIEMELVRHAEDKDDEQSFAVNPELGEYYFSSIDRMNKVFFNRVKEIGEAGMIKFVGRNGKEYADTYKDLTSRSYGANASRLSGTLIDTFVRERPPTNEKPVILDLGSGPDMLKRHIAGDLSDNVVSLDINPQHFDESDAKRIVGTFASLPLADNSVDYANMSLAYHYTGWLPSRGEFGRLQTLHELNRVLKPGGQAVITMMFSLDLMDEEAFGSTVRDLGFEIVDKYSGEVESGDNFKARLVTLKKIEHSPLSMEELTDDIDGDLKHSLRLKGNVKATVRDTRKIATHYTIKGQGDIKTIFNETDQQILDEETKLIQDMSRMRDKYGSIQEIPPKQIVSAGYARIYNGKSYVLFKRLTTGDGAVVVKNY